MMFEPGGVTASLSVDTALSVRLFSVSLMAVVRVKGRGEHRPLPAETTLITSLEGIWSGLGDTHIKRLLSVPYTLHR